MCGKVRRKPKFTPEMSNIVLLGPGVMLLTKAKMRKAHNKLEEDSMVSILDTIIAKCQTHIFQF